MSSIKDTMWETYFSPRWPNCSFPCYSYYFPVFLLPCLGDLKQLLCADRPLNQEHLGVHFTILFMQGHSWRFLSPRTCRIVSLVQLVCLWRNASCETRFWQKAASLLASSPSGSSNCWAARALEVTGLKWSAAPAVLHRDSWQLGCVPSQRQLRKKWHSSLS